jgi:hypothetical protein
MTDGTFEQMMDNTTDMLINPAWLRMLHLRKIQNWVCLSADRQLVLEILRPKFGRLRNRNVGWWGVNEISEIISITSESTALTT